MFQRAVADVLAVLRAVERDRPHAFVGALLRQLHRIAERGGEELSPFMSIIKAEPGETGRDSYSCLLNCPVDAYRLGPSQGLPREEAG